MDKIEEKQVELETTTTMAEPAAPEEEAKAGVVVWEYQNTNEECRRYVMFEAQPFVDMIRAGVMTREDYSKVMWAIDIAVDSMCKTFDMTPKDPQFDNVVRDDFLKKNEDLQQVKEVQNNTQE